VSRSGRSLFLRLTSFGFADLAVARERRKAVALLLPRSCRCAWSTVINRCPGSLPRNAKRIRNRTRPVPPSFFLPRLLVRVRAAFFRCRPRQGRRVRLIFTGGSAPKKPNSTHPPLTPRDSGGTGSRQPSVSAVLPSLRPRGAESTRPPDPPPPAAAASRVKRSWWLGVCVRASAGGGGLLPIMVVAPASGAGLVVRRQRRGGLRPPKTGGIDRSTDRLATSTSPAIRAAAAVARGDGW
jgi:hypothetical protein